jgi:hypothetical protein
LRKLIPLYRQVWWMLRVSLVGERRTGKHKLDVP